MSRHLGQRHFAARQFAPRHLAGLVVAVVPVVQAVRGGGGEGNRIAADDAEVLEFLQIFVAWRDDETR